MTHRLPVIGAALAAAPIVALSVQQPPARPPRDITSNAAPVATTAYENVLRLAEYRGRRKTVVYVSNGYDAPLGGRTNTTIHTVNAAAIVGNESSPDPGVSQAE